MKNIFDVSNEKLNNTPRVDESSWNYIDEICSLKNYISRVEGSVNALGTNVENRLLNQEKRAAYSVDVLTEKINSRLDESTKAASNTISKIVSDLTDLKLTLVNKVDAYDREHTERDTQIYNTINALNNKIDRIFFDVDERKDYYYVHYLSANGVSDYTRIKKLVADEESLTERDGTIQLKYQFSPRNFEIKDNVIRCTGMMLNTGKLLSANSINNDLRNATFNITQLTQRVESILTKINTLNGYVASNNFKKANPSQAQLTAFVLECLPKLDTELTINTIPTGTKIRNTFDNHIWVLNKVTLNGLTTSKWEDFGADNICIASNDGVHGLVAGSLDRLKGHIDIKGVISINGLEEELQSILESSLNLSNTINELQTRYDSRLLELEQRIRVLEENK